MKEDAFRNWLIRRGYDQSTANSRASNCTRICSYEGDLDTLYQQDRCAHLIAILNYSTSDERQGKAPLHHVPINGNKRTGTATLKQAAKLYIEFLNGELGAPGADGIHANSAYTTKQPAETVHRNQSTESKQTIDSYAQFLDYFAIDKMDFYTFGLDKTIFSDVDSAMQQWQGLKKRLLGNQPIAIRGYGRQGAHTELYLKLYSFLFKNEGIYEDATNNAEPRKNLQNVTGYRINRNILNYQCSHVFGHTKNPLLFEAVWNICFTPKLFDPFTGHETKGCWPEEYQRRFQKLVFTRFQRHIEDYNSFVDEQAIEKRIKQFVASMQNKIDSTLLQKFLPDALSEWSKICVREEGKP